MCVSINRTKGISIGAIDEQRNEKRNDNEAYGFREGSRTRQSWMH